MTTSLRWTSADLEALPENGKRYEIIDGELHVSEHPHWHHQKVCGRLFRYLDDWNRLILVSSQYRRGCSL